MATIEIKIKKFADLKKGSINSIEGVGCWNTLVDLVKNRNNSIYLTSDFEGIVAKLYYDAEDKDVKARILT